MTPLPLLGLQHPTLVSIIMSLEGVLITYFYMFNCKNEKKKYKDIKDVCNPQIQKTLVNL